MVVFPGLGCLGSFSLRYPCAIPAAFGVVIGRFLIWRVLFYLELLCFPLGRFVLLLAVFGSFPLRYPCANHALTLRYPCAIPAAFSVTFFIWRVLFYLKLFRFLFGRFFSAFGCFWGRFPRAIPALSLR